MSVHRPLAALTALTTVVGVVLATTAAAAPPTPEPPASDSAEVPVVDDQTGEVILPEGWEGWAPYPENGVTPMSVSGSITAGNCTYRQANDDPHTSGAYPNVDASIHGWWLRDTSGCPSRANVLVVIQAYWCGAGGCFWTGLDVGSGTFYPGPGSGRWANARNQCSDTGYQVGYRGYTDVDLPDRADPSGVTYSAIRNLYCAPS